VDAAVSSSHAPEGRREREIAGAGVSPSQNLKLTSRSCKALSTLSQRSATVAENGEKTATVALFCDSVDRA